MLWFIHSTLIHSKSIGEKYGQRKITQSTNLHQAVIGLDFQARDHAILYISFLTGGPLEPSL